MKAYKYRIYPTKTQASEIDLQIEKSRQLYNTLLGLKKDAYEQKGTSLSRKDLYKQTKDCQRYSTSKQAKQGHKEMCKKWKKKKTE